MAKVMRVKTQGLVAMAAVSLLAGCSTYSLKELRHTTPKGTAYQAALAKNYMDYAIQEEKNYDWFTSMYFADKGLRAAYGKDVEPEQPENWDVSAKVLPTMQKAREILLGLLTEQNKSQYPQVLARAVYSYDCWVENQEEAWQAEEIGSCRDGLQDAFERLNAPDIELAPMVDPEATPVKVAPPAVKPVELAPEADRVEAPVKEELEAKEEEISQQAAPEETPVADTAMPMDAQLLAQSPQQTAPSAPLPAPAPGKSISQAAVEQAAMDMPAGSWAVEPPATEVTAEDVPAQSKVQQRANNVREPAAAPVMALAPAGIDTSSYMVFFDDRRTGLPDEGKKVVDEISKTLVGTVDYAVVIGSGEHVEFAKERAEAVKKRLVEGGVKPEAVTVSVAQVPDFMADSGEGDSTPIRHRVEIYLNQ
jgi:outer membrane protein OmpA-like peptidoglycan-associated protein